MRTCARCQAELVVGEGTVCDECEADLRGLTGIERAEWLIGVWERRIEEERE